MKNGKKRKSDVFVDGLSQTNSGQHRSPARTEAHAVIQTIVNDKRNKSVRQASYWKTACTLRCAKVPLLMLAQRTGVWIETRSTSI